jgi:hypothetical protein
MSTLSELSSNVTSVRDHSQKYAFSQEVRYRAPKEKLVDIELYYRELSSLVFAKFKEQQYSDAIDLAVFIPESHWRDYTCSRLCESLLGQNTRWMYRSGIRKLLNAITSETVRKTTRLFLEDVKIFCETVELIEPSETDTTSEEERFENARQTLQSIYWDKVGIGDRSCINNTLGLPTTIRFQTVKSSFLNTNHARSVSKY